jgi:hypothetical protein
MIFPSPAGMSLTKLSPAGNNLIIPGQSDIPAGEEKIGNLFYSVKKGQDICYPAFENTAGTRLVNRTGSQSTRLTLALAVRYENK